MNTAKRKREVACAAVLKSETVETWGHKDNAGDWSGVQAALVDFDPTYSDLVFAAVHVYVVVTMYRFRLDSDHVPLPSASSSLSSSALSPQFTG